MKGSIHEKSAKMFLTVHFEKSTVDKCFFFVCWIDDVASSGNRDMCNARDNVCIERYICMCMYVYIYMYRGFLY